MFVYLSFSYFYCLSSQPTKEWQLPPELYENYSRMKIPAITIQILEELWLFFNDVVSQMQTSCFGYRLSKCQPQTLQKTPRYKQEIMNGGCLSFILPNMLILSRRVIFLITIPWRHWEPGQAGGCRVPGYDGTKCEGEDKIIFQNLL